MIGRFLAAMGILSLFTPLGGCGTPTDEDVIGVWVSQDGGQLNLNADGTFAARSLPQTVFFDRRRGDAQITGKGKWHLEKASGYWQVRLSFPQMPEYPQGFYTSVLVSGGGDSTTLFQWIEDQGGQRYELKRQHSPLAK